MFVLIWVTLVFNADTGASVGGRQQCSGFPFEFCITLPEGEITAEAGLCVVIPCSFTTSSNFIPRNLVWYKCVSTEQRCSYSDVIFNTNKNNIKIQSEFRGRVSQLEPDVSQRNCSIIINDLKESDSGSYQLRVNGILNGNQDGLRYSPRATVSIKALTQKPEVTIPPLTEGQQTTLTCTAPGLCSGSDPQITWTWRGAGEKGSHITGNITTNQRYTSTLTFTPLAEHHGMEIICKVSFTGNVTTEETVTLNVTSDVVQHHGSCTVLPWAITGISLSLNVCCIICILFLWNARTKVKPNQEDKTYMSLQKTNRSPEYDVIAQPLH